MLTGRSLLLKNSLVNLTGYILPLLAAIIVIPIIIGEYDEDRYSVLTILWAILGYVTLFDLGIGRGLTQGLSKNISINNNKDNAIIIWTSLVILIVIGIAGSVLLFLASEYIVSSLAGIEEGLITESILAIKTMSVLVPITTLTSGVRSLFESHQNFVLINKYRIPANILIIAAPALLLPVTDNLVAVSMAIVIIRFILLIVYTISARRRYSMLFSPVGFSVNKVKEVLTFGGWMTVSMIVSPIMTYLDRIIIGFILSTAVVGYYATPQEMATKIMFIPGAIVGVMFPAFAASYWSDRDKAQSIYRNLNKYMFIIMFPISFVIMVLSYEICSLWIGSEFADSSYLVMQIMSVGVLFVSLAYISFSLIQGAGRADITGITQLLEAPIYVVMFVYAISEYGISGGAFVWTLRLVVETIIFSLIVENKILVSSSNVDDIKKTLIYGIITTICIIGFSAMFIYLDLARTANVMNLYIATSICIIIFISYAVKNMLSKEEMMLVHDLIYKRILKKND